MITWFTVNFMAIETKTKRMAIGKHQNVSVLVEDLEKLKRLQHPEDGSLAVTFHRIIEAAEAASGELKQIKKAS